MIKRCLRIRLLRGPGLAAIIRVQDRAADADNPPAFLVCEVNVNQPAD
jgi:hypothetical protein